jgi:hypothetical protein
MFQLTDKAGKKMNATKGKLMLAAIVTAVAASASITRADDQPVVYGRAGIPVAEQRIQQLSQIQSHDSAASKEQVAWYGRAGYTVGADAVKTLPPAPKAYAAGQGSTTPAVFGRAGYALPFGG